MTQPTLVRPAPRPAPESPAVQALLEVSQALSAATTITAGLNRVLGLLTDACGARRSAITLIDPATGLLYIEAASGIAPDGRRARYRLGEGITGRVVEHGKPIVVPQVSREPLFLYRAAKRGELGGQEISFVCVPIAIGTHTIGALSVDLPYEPGRDYEALTLLLCVVASQVAQALKIQRLLDAERDRQLGRRLLGGHRERSARHTRTRQIPREQLVQQLCAAGLVRIRERGGHEPRLEPLLQHARAEVEAAEVADAAVVERRRALGEREVQ